ncbi:MAG: amino acid permease [Elusimicrobia bacterium]|nr:amino acid permease [Elusimicrobiota bacterium]
MSGRRPLTRSHLTALGVNAVVGSSIFLFPGLLAGMLGPASIAAFFLTALLLSPVALCFAEAASSRDRAGGPGLYAQQAFGPTAGFAIGWLCWIVEIVSWAAIAAGLSAYAVPFWPALGSPWAAKIVAAAAVAGFAGLNLLGARPGARAAVVLAAAKLLPLVALALAGLPRLAAASWRPFAPHGWSPLPGACFLAYFAFQGFEVVPVPAGEAQAPERDAPFAVLASLGGAAVLYMLVQAAALASVPGLAASTTPLSDAGRALFGPAGGALIAAGALLSMLGFLAGCALGGPRYLVALAEEGHLPAVLARPSGRGGAPRAAILLTAAAALAGALTLDFERLVDFGNVVIGAQYAATCAAVLADRRRGRASAFRAPGGAALPLLGIAATATLSAQGGWARAAAAAACLGAGFLLRAGARRLT